MPKIAANLNLLFQEVPVAERIGAAKKAGFAGIEFLIPYDQSAITLAADLEKHHMPLVLINTPAGDWDAGERGMAAIPNRVQEFRDGFRRALEIGEITRPETIHIMAGIAQGPDSLHCYLDNLNWACSLAPDRLFLIEPISAAGCAGYFLNSLAQARDIITELALPNLFLQFDVFHAAMSGQDPISAFDRYQPLIRHIQIASVPDRAEPDHGTVDIQAFIAHVTQRGYNHWISAEYFPAADTAQGLNWLACYNKNQAQD